MDFQRSDEQQLIYRTAFDLAEAEFDAEAFTWEDEFPRTNQRILSGAGTAGDRAPGGYGGGGGYSVVEVLLAQEAVGRVCPDTAHVPPVPRWGPPRVIAELGSDYLKEKYLPAVCSGDQIISVAISESEAGSDASNMQTTVERDGDRLVLNGSKMWITKGEQAGAFLVYARFPDGNIGPSSSSIRTRRAYHSTTDQSTWPGMSRASCISTTVPSGRTTPRPRQGRIQGVAYRVQRRTVSQCDDVYRMRFERVRQGPFTRRDENSSDSRSPTSRGSSGS